MRLLLNRFCPTPEIFLNQLLHKTGNSPLHEIVNFQPSFANSLFIIAAIASVSHIGVSFVQSAVEIGGALFIVSVFIHLTKIASLVLLYLACKTADSLAPQLKV